MDPRWISLHIRPGERLDVGVDRVHAAQRDGPSRLLVPARRGYGVALRKSSPEGPTEYCYVPRRPSIEEWERRYGRVPLPGESVPVESEESPFFGAESEALVEAATRALGGAERLDRALLAVATLGFTRRGLSTLYAAADHSDRVGRARYAEDLSPLLEYAERLFQIDESVRRLGPPAETRVAFGAWVARARALIALRFPAANGALPDVVPSAWESERKRKHQRKKGDATQARKAARRYLFDQVRAAGVDDPVETVALVEAAWLVSAPPLPGDEASTGGRDLPRRPRLRGKKKEAIAKLERSVRRVKKQLLQELAGKKKKGA